MNNRNYHIETLALHAGQEIEPATRARAVPVYRTTAYNFKSSQHGADLFALREPGNIYARLMNPTNDVLEKRLAQLDGGAAALTLSSGTAAIYFAVTNILRQGDELVSANNLYGGTFTQFDAILPQQGITVRFAPVNDFAATEAAINEKTRALYIETVGNPALDVADIEGYAAIAKKHHLPLIVDATFTPPTLLRPIEHGANIVIHSLSKWIGGHGTGIGGVVVDAGNFDWTDPKFSLYNEPDRGYHGLRFAHDLGELNPLAFILRLRTVGLRNQGPTLAPDAAWLFLQGVESLPLRMERHSSNARKVAEFLKHHPKVAWVRYPGLSGDPSHELAQKYLPDGAGGMVVFGVRGGSAEGIKLVDNIELFSILANVGDAKSLIIHPASTTHSQLSDEDQRKAGLTPELVRLSIGLEHVDDIIAALDDALILI
ncbi:MAG TPA: O-acetylhomoserine aminocarboxypropyltransferase/cysteine synthase [Lentisphaeria bacterium]|uniref:O-acetylhomoserine aminocarboxypropyltransferase/cysteine synthase family protein n=2 Tax=Victivallis TaxID=172900 RepID=UPI000D02D87B|nr:O-acetylhomoserine aminocarboxypropyltransferase/cysteine synthase family protein [uncultured Victivallis sp.]AVM46966.1 O-acetylhomoserine aminocarboxypropyltransferase [Victivallales bacterium CCUG 44730]HBP05806.1 O-acetylhomoserine aminocarboxypropyltransferase/cysteine synthase [Lentisphaeria bacterium]HCH86922.1 O-acetylhomoserine aminocarboxypropyltransferase/cysteine synthase [Lentisphaeria bacterium]